MNSSAEIAKSIANLLWPIFAFVVLATFKAEIRGLLNRLRKGKLLGQEIELADLEQLNIEAQKAVKETTSLPKSANETNDDAYRISLDRARSIEEQVFSLLATSPSAALLLLSTEIEQELNLILGVQGLLPPGGFLPLKEGVDVLQSRGSLSPHLPSSLRLFQPIRNKLVHGRSTDSSEIVSAIDSGITILRALKAVPREVHRVHAINVPIYLDSEGEKPAPEGHAIILCCQSPGGTQSSLRIFPTEQNHFIVGQMVAWEWANNEKVWPECWYRDPDSGQIKYAWTSSCEFIGRLLQDYPRSHASIRTIPSILT